MNYREMLLRFSNLKLPVNTRLDPNTNIPVISELKINLAAILDIIIEIDVANPLSILSAYFTTIATINPAKA